MAKLLNKQISEQYPDAIELNNLLKTSEWTWARYGLSLKDLSEYEPDIIEMIKIIAQ